MDAVISVPAGITFLAWALCWDQGGIGGIPEMEMDGKSPCQAGMTLSISPLLLLTNPSPEQSLGQGCHQCLSAHQRLHFPHPGSSEDPPASGSSWETHSLTSLSLQLWEEASGEDAEDCPVCCVLGKSGCWGGTRTMPLLLLHFDLSVCWGSQLLEVREK